MNALLRECSHASELGFLSALSIRSAKGAAGARPRVPRTSQLSAAPSSIAVPHRIARTVGASVPCLGLLPPTLGGARRGERLTQPFGCAPPTLADCTRAPQSVVSYTSGVYHSFAGGYGAPPGQQMQAPPPGRHPPRLACHHSTKATWAGGQLSPSAFITELHPHRLPYHDNLRDRHE